MMIVTRLHLVRRQAFMLLGCAVLMLLLVQHTMAAELRWQNRPFQIIANEKPLNDFLRELASSQGITAVIDPKVGGVISGKFDGPAKNILNSVCSVNGLTWYFDGAFLFVDLAADAKSEVLPIAAENAGRIAETLVRLHISDERYPLSISERDASVYVTGPRRYVEMVRQAVKLADQKSAMAEGAEIRLFPLKYAWASDFRINRSGKETVIPGVANVLRSLYGRAGNQSSGGGSGGRGTIGPSRSGRTGRSSCAAARPSMRRRSISRAQALAPAATRALSAAWPASPATNCRSSRPTRA